MRWFEFEIIIFAPFSLEFLSLFSPTSKFLRKCILFQVSTLSEANDLLYKTSIEFSTGDVHTAYSLLEYNSYSH